MNILLLTYQGDYSGATNSIAFLAQGLANKGHNVYVGCRKESLLYQKLQNAKAVLIPMTFKNKTDIVNIKQISDAVRKYDIQIINAQSSKDRYTSIFAKLLYNLNVKIVHTRRQFPLSIGGILQNFFYIQNTEKIVVVSEQLKKTFIKKGIPENHLRVIYNGTPSSRYNEVNEESVNALREKFNILETDTVIGCVSRLKNQDQLVEALQYLDPSITVMFVGIEPHSLDEYVEKYKVKNRIIYAGIVNEVEVLNYYKLFDLNILCSTMDGFGLVLVEAMALGVPVIGTRHGGIMDVIQDGRNGLLFKDGNIEELTEKIKTILYNKEVRQNLIENGKYTSLVKFSIEKTIDNYETFYSELLTEELSVPAITSSISN